MAATTKPTNGVLLTSSSLLDLGFRRGALQMLVEIRQALHFLYIHIVHTVETFRAVPVAAQCSGSLIVYSISSCRPPFTMRTRSTM